MVDILGFLLGLLSDLVFWKKKRKRRKLEKENNLPKKVMINPVSKVLIGIIIILILLKLYQKIG